MNDRKDDRIEEFLKRYSKEYDYYLQAARLVQQKLEDSLQSAGVRSIVTARAKSVEHLSEKCYKRAAKNGSYESVDRIYEDIVDLAGVRVALYFPGQFNQVDSIVRSLFRVTVEKTFPPSDPASNDSVDPSLGKVSHQKRFPGYKANHYHVRLKDDVTLEESDKRYTEARVEVQVASVLMHAWSEVEHDLIYKPLEGELSHDEYAILDMLNGLVASGEIALEQLQRAGDARVTADDRRIASHWELATLLLSAGEKLTGEPISESGLGRVDELYSFIRELEIDTPKNLRPYIEALHDNLEVRPLAEQIVDALLSENSSRLDVYNSVRRRLPWTDSEGETYRHIGMFLTHWTQLEALVRSAAPDPRGRPIIPTLRVLEGTGLLTRETAFEFDQLRRMRNLLVHGIEIPPITVLDESTARLKALLAEIELRLQDKGNSE